MGRQARCSAYEGLDGRSRVSAWTRWVVVGRWPGGRVEAIDESVVRV